MVVVSGLKQGKDVNKDGKSDIYYAGSLSHRDYYPFGGLMAGRTYMPGDYRFGFNGKENDNEVEGEGNQQDYGFRIYDPRLGRFLSVDPLTEKYGDLSPYSFANNSPVANVDLEGKHAYLVIWFTQKGEIGHAGIAVDNYKTVYNKIKIGSHEYSIRMDIPDGTVTYYDFWPGTSADKTNATKDLDGKIQKNENILLEDLISSSYKSSKGQDPSGGEEREPEGIIQMNSNSSVDEQVKSLLESMYKTDYDKDHGNDPVYNGCSNNCASFAQKGVQALGGVFGSVNGIENVKSNGVAAGVELADPINKNIITPNFLFNSVKRIVQMIKARELF